MFFLECMWNALYFRSALCFFLQMFLFFVVMFSERATVCFSRMYAERVMFSERIMFFFSSKDVFSEHDMFSMRLCFRTSYVYLDLS
jgi:hypothetical protein